MGRVIEVFASKARFSRRLERDGNQEEVKPEVNLQSSYLGCGNINVEVNDCMAVLETDLSGFLSITASFISFEITAGLYIGIDVTPFPTPDLT